MKTSFLSDSQYNFTKHLVQTVLPATGALYFGLSQIWGFPYGEEVVGTLALLTTFLGLVVGVSLKRYEASPDAYDGQLILVEDAAGVKTYSLELDTDPEMMVDKDKVTFEVRPVSE